MNRLKRNEIVSDVRGFTLIEMTITSGFLVAAMLAFANSAVLHAKAQVSLNTEAAIAMLFGQVQGIVSAEWSCTAAIAGSSYAEPLPLRDPVSLKPVANEGMAGGNAWKLTRVRLQDVEPISGQPGVLRGSLLIQASKDMALNSGSPTVTRIVPDIYFEINPDGAIARCYTTSDTVAAGQSACQLLGGIWAASATGGSFCQLPTPAGG